MKRFLFFILSLVAFTSGLVAQDAFYIYRNDGQFNAFFTDEVDSIKYSNTGIDSLLYDEVVVQEVYTADSVFRIPLASIDSIGFTSPEVIYKPGVRRVEDLMKKYLKSVDGLNLSFTKSMPLAEQPRAGDVLLCLDFDNPMFKEGYAGKVKSVIDDGDNIIVVCDSIGDLSEIFSQFIAVEDVVSDSSGPRSIRRAETPERTLVKYDIDLTKELLKTEHITASLDGHLGGSSRLKVEYNIKQDNQYLKMTFTNTFGLGIGVGVKGEYSSIVKHKLASLPAVHFPASLPILKCAITPYLFLSGNLNASLDIHGELTKTTIYTITYNNGEFRGNLVEGQQNKPSLNWGSEFSLDGSLHGGILFDFYLGTVDIPFTGFIGASMETYIGPKLSGQFNIDMKEALLSDKIYETFKDNKVTFSALAIDIKAKGKAQFLGQEVKEKTFWEKPYNFFNWDFYFFPEFTQPTLTKDPSTHSAKIETTVSRSVMPFLDLRLGFGLYDKNDEAVKIQYDERPYKFRDNYSDLSQTFSAIGLGDYTLRPVIQFHDKDIPAMPATALEYTLKPVVDDASINGKTHATLYGHLAGELDYVNEDCETGFVYSTDKSLAADAKRVVATMNGNGKMNVEITGLAGGTTYFYAAYLSVNGDTIWSEETKSFTMPLPVTINKFEQASVAYYPQHYSYNNKNYDFKFNAYTYITLEDDNDIADWGYYYVDPDGVWSAPRSLKPYNMKKVKDGGLEYCRNTYKGTVTLVPYVKYVGQDIVGKGQPVTYGIEYPATTSLTLTGCTFKGTTTYEQYKGKTWKYKSSFHFDYNATGAYWLKTGVEEIKEGNSGWEGWEEELEHQAVSCVDGPNGTTIDYYYDDKEFFGEYKVRLIGKDATHGNNCRTDGYVIFHYDNNQFTGCSLINQ